MKRLVVLILFIANQAEAIRSTDMLLVGQIVSFDKDIVSIKSGNRIYDLPKKDLNFPSFKVGTQIEVPTTEQALKKIPSHQAKH